MRKVTEKAVAAFVAGQNFNSANTKVEVRDGESFLYLHGNMIAHLFNQTNGKKGLFITTCGWETNTTKERLNGVLSSLDLPTISQRNFVWYIGEKEMKGTKIFNHVL